jgi:hypothetical protein
MSRLGLLLASTVVVAACNGVIGDLGGAPAGGESSAVCTGDPGPSPVRRLTRFEYDNTIRDLLGDDSHPARTFPAEEEAFGFSNNATILGVTPVLAEQYLVAAETLAKSAIAKLPALNACDPLVEGEARCAKVFVERFGKKALRRPLDDEERGDFFAVYQTVRDEGGTYEDGMRAIVSALLQSPAFLYRLETGDPASVQGARMRLGQYEIASRLSYLLWGSMPDDALFRAADEGRLGTDAEIEAQARRMVDDPKTQDMVAEFHKEWLALAKLDVTSKTATTYPAWNDDIKRDLATETELFIKEAFFRDRTVEALLTAPYTFVNANLANYYGLPAPKADGFVKVSLDPNQRLGLLTQGSLMSIYAKANQGSPIHRGKFVRERLLCDEISPPPPNLMPKAPDVEAGLSERDRFSQHTKDASCAHCHQLMDPIGFGFGNFDGIGRYRSTDGDKPVDATGQIVNADDATGSFSGVPQLAQRLAHSKKVSDCVVTQWFRFGYGRAETDADRCTMDALKAKLTAAKGDLRELIVQLALTDAFKYRRALMTTVDPGVAK